LKISVSQENLNTIFGILAILFWGTTIAFSRSLTEQLGPLTAASWIYMLSGVWGCIYLINKPGGIKKTFQLPILYLIGCGTLFIFYMVCLYLAVGLAFSREQVYVSGRILLDATCDSRAFIYVGFPHFFSLYFLG